MKRKEIKKMFSEKNTIFIVMKSIEKIDDNELRAWDTKQLISHTEEWLDSLIELDCSECHETFKAQKSFEKGKCPHCKAVVEV